VVSGQAPQKPGMKSCGVCALGCSAFRGSDRFTVTRSVQKGRGISLSRCDLPVISALVSIRQRQVSESSYARKLRDRKSRLFNAFEIFDHTEWGRHLNWMAHLLGFVSQKVRPWTLSLFARRAGLACAAGTRLCHANQATQRGIDGLLVREVLGDVW
jgi:hypothetical protein